MYVITRSITLKCGEKVNVKVIVKEEDKKVIAIVNDKICGLNYITDIVVRIINKYFYNNGIAYIGLISNSKLTKDLELNDYYRTIATCVPEDTWDDRKGIEIALYKMKSKLDMAVSNRLMLFYDKLSVSTNEFAKKFFGTY